MVVTRRYRVEGVLEFNFVNVNGHLGTHEVFETSGMIQVEVA